MNEQKTSGERQAIHSSLARIASFVESQPFRALLNDLYRQPAHERREFVNRVVLDEGELARRGVVVPRNLVIQRSAFKDKRPTLFCVTEKLPEGCAWNKATFTFDNEPISERPLM